MLTCTLYNMEKQTHTQVEAYVTFVGDHYRDECLELQPKTWTKRMMQDKKLRFRSKHTLRITE